MKIKVRAFLETWYSRPRCRDLPVAVFVDVDDSNAYIARRLS